MERISVGTMVEAPLERVWELWNEPEHITKWAFASDDWEAPRAENDLRVGGRFSTRMQAKDGSAGFDFTGEYTRIVWGDAGEIEGPRREASGLRIIEYTMDDGRRVETEFAGSPEGVRITTTFDPEGENSREVQRAGWQAILDNFKRFAERVPKAP